MKAKVSKSINITLTFDGDDELKSLIETLHFALKCKIHFEDGYTITQELGAAHHGVIIYDLASTLAKGLSK